MQKEIEGRLISREVDKSALVGHAARGMPKFDKSSNEVRLEFQNWCGVEQPGSSSGS